MTAAFFVPGIPAPGGSKRAFATRSGRIAVVDDCRRNKNWRATVALFAKQAHEGGPLLGPLRLDIVFVMPRPKGHLGTGRNGGMVKASAPTYPTTKPDATKLLRSTEDALTGLLWADDAQVVEQRVAKRYAAPDEGPGAWIRLQEVAA